MEFFWWKTEAIYIPEASSIKKKWKKRLFQTQSVDMQSLKPAAVHLEKLQRSMQNLPAASPVSTFTLTVCRLRCAVS